MKIGRTDMQKKSSFIASATSGSWCLVSSRLGKGLVRNSGIGARHAALDVACGTGIVARLTADRVVPSGSVVGLDANEAMLTVARAQPASTGAQLVEKMTPELFKPTKAKYFENYERSTSPWR